MEQLEHFVAQSLTLMVQGFSQETSDQQIFHTQAQDQDMVIGITSITDELVKPVPHN